MPTDSIFDKLRLIRSPNIGPVSYRQLLARFGTAVAALEALPHLAVRGGSRQFTAASADTIDRELAAIQAIGANCLFIGDPSYPALLAELNDAPAAITYLGDISLFNRDVVAIVGARNASAGACRFSRQLAHDLGHAGFNIVSGLARGIDTAAHLGSIATGTIGVIAGGIDVVYPPENRGLQHEIAEKGLLLAEMSAGTEPRARHFPHRNRIIAGLALGTVVVEAAPRSGSLITARMAAENGREVMAIPGSPIDPRARGCNQLIRDGATLVQDAAEVAELLRPMDGRMQRLTEESSPQLFSPVTTQELLEDERTAVINLLGMSQVNVDEVVRQSGVDTGHVQMVLLELELAGRLERGAGATVRLKS